MEKMIYISEKSYKENDKKVVKLKYYMIEECRPDKKQPIYGIRILKRYWDSGRIVQEEEMSPAISYSRDLVQQMVFTLSENMVTPRNMLETLDDMVTEEINNGTVIQNGV